MINIRSATRISILVILLLGLGGLSAFAQFLSGVEGTVRDSSGALIAGAKVTLTDTRLGIEKVDTTSQAGYFRIDSIAASTYTMHIEMASFKTWDQKNLVLQVGEIRTVAPVLEVGQVSAEVTVSASEVSLNLVSASTGSVIPEETVKETPLTGQNVYGLAALTPGITGAAVETAGNDNYTNEYAININAAGLRQEQNGYQIDGAYNRGLRLCSNFATHQTVSLSPVLWWAQAMSRSTRVAESSRAALSVERVSGRILPTIK